MTGVISAFILVFVLIGGVYELGYSAGSRQGQIEVFTGEYVCSKLQDNSIACVKPTDQNK